MKAMLLCVCLVLLAQVELHSEEPIPRSFLVPRSSSVPKSSPVPNLVAAPETASHPNTEGSGKSQQRPLVALIDGSTITLGLPPSQRDSFPDQGNGDSHRVLLQAKALSSADGRRFRFRDVVLRTEMGFLAWAEAAEVDTAKGIIHLSSSDRPVMFRYEPESGAEIAVKCSVVSLAYRSNQVHTAGAQGHIRLQDLPHDSDQPSLSQEDRTQPSHF